MSHQTSRPSLPDTSPSRDPNPSRHRCSRRPEVCGDLGDFFQWKNLIQMEEIVEEDEDDNEDDDDGSLCSCHDDSGICRTGSECSTAGLEWYTERERENCRYTDQSCKTSAEYLHSLTSSSKSSRSDYCGCSMSSGSNHHSSADDILDQSAQLIVCSPVGSVGSGRSLVTQNSGPIDDAWSISGLLSETEDFDEEDDFDYSQLLDQSLYGGKIVSKPSPQTLRYVEDCISRNKTSSSQSDVAAPPLPPRNSTCLSVQSVHVLPRAIAAVPRMGTKLSYHDLRLRNHNLRPTDSSPIQSTSDLSPNQSRSPGSIVHQNNASSVSSDACNEFRSINNSLNESRVEQPDDSFINTKQFEDTNIPIINNTFHIFPRVDKLYNDSRCHSMQRPDTKPLRCKKRSRRKHLQTNNTDNSSKSCMGISDIREYQLDDSGLHLDTTSDCEKSTRSQIDEVASPVYEEPWDSSILIINPAKISHSSPAAEITSTSKCHSTIPAVAPDGKRMESGSLLSDCRGKCRERNKKCCHARKKVSQRHTNELVDEQKARSESKSKFFTMPCNGNVENNVCAIANGVDCFVVYEGNAVYEEVCISGDAETSRNNNQLLQILSIGDKNDIYSLEKPAEDGNNCDKSEEKHETFNAEYSNEKHQNEKSLTDVYNRYVEVMYTNKRNLAHTIAIQQQLFQQQLKLSADKSLRNTSTSCINNNGEVCNDNQCENFQSDNSSTSNNSKSNSNNSKSNSNNSKNSKCKKSNCVNSKMSHCKVTKNQLEGSGESSSGSFCSCSLKSSDNDRVANNNEACENFSSARNKLESNVNAGICNIADLNCFQRERSDDLVNCIVENPMEWVVKRRKDGSRYITRRPVKFNKKMSQNVSSSFVKCNSNICTDSMMGDRFIVSTDKMSSDEKESPAERQPQPHGQTNMSTKKNLTHKNTVQHRERKNGNDPVLLSVVTV